MKIVTSIFVGLLFTGVNALANAPEPAESKQVIVNISDALVPATVDADTEVKAVVSGMFPNGCYSYNRADVSHDSHQKTHRVKTIADVIQGMCIMVLVPFTKEVSLGRMGQGEHTVRFINGDDTYMERKIIVR